VSTRFIPIKLNNSQLKLQLIDLKKREGRFLVSRILGKTKPDKMGLIAKF